MRVQHRWAARLTLGAALAGLAGCEPPVRARDAGAGQAGTDGAAASAGEVRFATLQRDLFDQHCVTDCHESANAAANLQLTRGRSYASLVNQPSQQIATQLRVVPGDPGASYLLKKLQGGVGIVGAQMPKLAPVLPASQLEAVRAWIKRGAPND